MEDAMRTNQTPYRKSKKIALHICIFGVNRNDDHKSKKRKRYVNSESKMLNELIPVFITHPICKDNILKHLQQRNRTRVHKFQCLLIIWLLKAIIFTKPTVDPIKIMKPASPN
ncbi:hypothetical protein H5410_023120 [Solanum commersonii]|uniref:Uncharacterized protein n=1 Tax=Solanum commersonii TaxID=4109 RepID=A0A9J5ZIH3_SOLCO|nr:hypothetical protein H5410_023120 [Solanum commersonii]